MVVKFKYLVLLIALIGIKGTLCQNETESVNVVESTTTASTDNDDAEPELVIENENGTHPCDRECVGGEEPKYCYYHFDMEWYHSMSKACYDCPFNEEDCKREGCIPADGINRTLTVINRKMPGPAIVVCENDTIVVDLLNNLKAEATTIHWHGILQQETPYMDGAPYVTQCPVEPGATFRYQFPATPYGTQFWHSHSGMQRGDGINGALVIRRPKELDQHGDLYDFDLTEHTVIITDWIHELGISMFTRANHYNGTTSAPTLLVNGLGRFKVFNETDEGNVYMKVSRFNVTQGSRYRFRLINVEFMNCPIEFSVDGHNLTFIATDGYDIEPVTVSSLVAFAGERYDFVIEANNTIDNYWMRFRGLSSCNNESTSARQVAVLHYDGASDDEPEGDLTWEESFNPGVQLNPLNRGEEDNTTTISVSELTGLESFNDTDVLKEVADYQFYISYDFYLKNNTDFFDVEHYPINAVHESFQTSTPQLNHISFKSPVTPLLSGRPSNETFCSSETVSESCDTDYCACTHVLQVPLNAVVELIILDEGQLADANHPFHLHGHSFLVLEQRRLSNATTVAQVQEYDSQGLITRNLVNPPRKDTVAVPDGGYAVLRFKADNPGYWLFHCHIEFHFEVGMALVFKIGEHDEMVAVPDNFPTCGDFTPEIAR